MGSRSSPGDSSDATEIASSLERPERFAAIFDRHFDSVHGYLARRIGASLADDLAAHTFVVAFERRQSFRDTADTARPWLLGIATNLMRNQWRAERRATAALASLASEQAAGRATPDAERPATEMLAVALEQLDRGQRDALLLYAWEGLSYEEIAVALGVPIGTVRSRIARARSRLSSALSTSDPASSRQEIANDR
jgi:RNA polymerase sigma factor (sigma-70 family)